MKEWRNTRTHVQITIFLITAFILRGVRNDKPYEGPPTPPGDEGGLPPTPPDMPGGKTSTRHRYTQFSTVRRKRKRTTPPRMSFAEDCDYLAFYCLKAYKTGEVCGRTIYYRYFNFMNYCMLDYVNCMERYEVWQVAHMGECFNVTAMDDYLRYEYNDDRFLDQYYIIQE